MPNRVLEAFILGRNLAIQRRQARDAHEKHVAEEKQREIENKRNEQLDKQREKQEDRLLKQADQAIAVQETQLKLQRAQMKAGLDLEKGQGLVPFSRQEHTVKAPAQYLDTTGLNLPKAISGQQLNPKMEVTGGVGDFQFDIPKELREVLGEDVATETPEDFEKLIDIAQRRQGLAALTESQKASVQAAKIREQAQITRDNYLETKKRIEKEEDRKLKLEDDKRKREESNADFKDRSRFSASVTASRQIQAEDRKKQSELKALQETVGTSAGKALGIQFAAGQQRFNPSDAQFAAMSVQEVMPEILKAQGIEAKPGEIYIPINLEQGQRIRDSSSIIPALQRVQKVATKLVKDGVITESLAASMREKTFEELKDIVGLSENKKLLEPLMADSIILARKITNDRVTDRDATAFVAQLIGLGLNTELMNGRISELVDRTKGAIRRDTTGIPESQLKAFYPEVLDLDIYKNTTDSGETDLEKAIRLGLVQ